MSPVEAGGRSFESGVVALTGAPPWARRDSARSRRGACGRRHSAGARSTAAPTIGRLLPGDRAHPRPDPGLGTSDAEQAALRLVDHLVLELVGDDTQTIESELSGVIECLGRYLDPLHGQRFRFLRRAPGLRFWP